jgi:hypothetical protein
MPLVATRPPRGLKNFTRFAPRAREGTKMKLLEPLWFASPLLAILACGKAEGESGAYEFTGTEAGGTTHEDEEEASGGAAGEAGNTGTGASAGSAPDGSGGTGPGCTSTGDGAGIPIPASCEPLNQCLKRACGASYTECLGPDPATGNYAGSACARTFECIETCNCERACAEACYENDDTCAGCLAGLVLCGYECEDELDACQG